MRERLLVLALAAGALALFYLLIFPKPSGPSSVMMSPVSNETGPDGYLATWRWLGEQHIPAVSLRYRYDRLAPLAPRPTGNLLLATLPQRVPARAAELGDLEQWIERGNTLLVMTALDDTPLWTVGADPLLSERLKRMTGLELIELKQPNRSLASLNARRLEIAPKGMHPLLAGVGHITALSALPLARWQVSPENDLVPLELAERSDNGDPALWLVRRGAGQVILFGVGSAFSNAALALSDNARLLANLIAWSLRPGGAVIFDDAHQGLTAFYDGKAFFADPRLHRTLVWIVVLWLAFVLGSLPLRSAQHIWQPLDEAAYVEASARYFAAVVRPGDAAKRLIEEFLRGLRERLNLATEGSVWEWLDAQARVSVEQRSALQARYASACAGERVDLAAVQNLLAQLRRSVQ